MEAALDEENREVLAALDEMRRPSSPLPKFRSARTATPPPQVRSMLDVDPPTPRHGSIAGIGVGVTSPTSIRRAGKELDPSDPSSWTSPHSSKPSSPVLTKSSPILTRPRHSSETDRPVGLPKIQMHDKDFEQNYQFDLASIPSSGPAVRSPLESRRPREGSGSAMAAALSGDLGSLHVGLPAAGRGATPSRKSHSKSPSPQARKADGHNARLLSPTSPPPQLTTKMGTVVDDQAHLRLTQTKSDSFSTMTDDSEDPGRITKDDISVGEDEAVDTDDDQSSDEDETRGRSERRRRSENGGGPVVKSPGSSATSSPEETKRLPHSQQFVKSLLEPSISVTSPTGERLADGKAETGPPTARRASTASAVTDDEDDEAAAIRKAKSLGLVESPLDTAVPNRHVQIMIRGDWMEFQQEADAGKRSTRSYLLCSDLSIEASYAMEWVVGTMMRDGDTLLVMNAIEDENAPKTTESEKEQLTAEGNQAGEEASDAMDSLTRQTTLGGGTSTGLGKQLKYVPATEAESLTGSVDARKVGRKEMERIRAVESLKTDFFKLVRKTTLQVRCMVEVIHCRSPKHLILGAVSQIPRMTRQPSKHHPRLTSLNLHFASLVREGAALLRASSSAPFPTTLSPNRPCRSWWHARR
jgi:hypothetical protein